MRQDPIKPVVVAIGVWTLDHIAGLSLVLPHTEIDDANTRKLVVMHIKSFQKQYQLTHSNICIYTECHIHHI